MLSAQGMIRSVKVGNFGTGYGNFSTRYFPQRWVILSAQGTARLQRGTGAVTSVQGKALCNAGYGTFSAGCGERVHSVQGTILSVRSVLSVQGTATSVQLGTSFSTGYSTFRAGYGASSTTGAAHCRARYIQGTALSAQGARNSLPQVLQYTGYDTFQYRSLLSVQGTELSVHDTFSTGRCFRYRAWHGVRRFQYYVQKRPFQRRARHSQHTVQETAFLYRVQYFQYAVRYPVLQCMARCFQYTVR